MIKPNFNAITFDQMQEIEAAAMIGFGDNGHSLISPSGYHSWGTCVGYLNGIHNERAKGSDNLASVEGTAGHFFLEICLTLLIDPFSFDKSVDIPEHILMDIRKWAFNVSSKPHNSKEVQDLAIKLANDLINRELDIEFKQEIKKVTDVVWWYVNQGYTLIPEARVSIFKFFWHNASNGTSDIVLYNPTTKHVIIADLKYGIGVEVFPEANGQLVIYCLGVLAMLLDAGHDIQNWSIDIVVCQPRIGNRYWDAWQTDYAFMLEFASKARSKSARALYAIGHPESVTQDDYRPTVNGCRFCAHKTGCAPRLALAEKQLESVLAGAGIILSESSIPESPTTEPIGKLITHISSDHLAKIFHATPFIQAVLIDVESEIHKRMVKNNPVTGVKLVHGRGSRKFDMKDDELESLLKKHNVYDQSIKIKLPSPAQFEKILVDKSIKSEIMSHVTTYKGKPVLALEQDKRKSISEIRDEESALALASAGITISNN